MARQQSGGRNLSGRTTPKKEVVEPGDTGIRPLHKRNPFMFWAIMVAAAAMVLSTLTGFIVLLA